MKTWVPLFLLATLAAAGCATTEATAPPPPAAPSTSATPATPPTPPTPPTPAAPARDERSYAFSCDNGERIQVRFSRSRNSATLVRNGDSVELPQQTSGSGFIYGNGRTTLRGKDDELIVEVGKMAPTHCHEG